MHLLGYTQENNDLQIAQNLATALKEEGFQSITIQKSDNNFVVAYENRVYRFEGLTLEKIIQITADHLKNKTEKVVIITKRNNVPQISTTIDLSEDITYENIDSNKNEWLHGIKINQNIDGISKGAILVKDENSAKYKLELVVRPYFTLELGSLTIDDAVIHLIDLRPKLNYYLWKGAHLTYEFILPISSEFKNVAPQWSVIRPRVVSFTQQFRLRKSIFLNISIGLFSRNTYGISTAIGKYFLEGKLLVHGKMGYTGHASYIRYNRLFDQLSKGWVYTDLNYLDYKVGVNYWFPKWNLQIGLDYGKVLNDRTVWRASFSQKFKEIDLGFYMHQTDQGRNYGMNIGIPIFPKKYWKPNKYLSVRPSKQLRYNYDATFYLAREYQAQGMYDGFPQDLNPYFLENSIMNYDD